jgi:hypothetical protein
MAIVAESVWTSRALILTLCLIVWSLLYLDARWAYRLARSAKRASLQLSSVLVAIVIFVLQINLMERLAPSDAYGSRFFAFILIECGGGMVVLFSTLFRERARCRKMARTPTPSV